MLCILCAGLDGHQFLLSNARLDHHKTYADPSLSASPGCELCTVAHIAVLETCSQAWSLPTKDVVQRHLEQDKTESQRHEDFRSRFTLELAKAKLDTRFSPFSAGVHGILCSRCMPSEIFELRPPHIALSTLKGTKLVPQLLFAHG
jgi:hypothetical protein